MVVVICCGQCAISCGCCNQAVGCHCGWVVLLDWLMSQRLQRAVMPRCRKYLINWFYFVCQIMVVWLSWLECWLHVSGWLRVRFLLLLTYFLKKNKDSATHLTLGNPWESFLFIPWEYSHSQVGFPANPLGIHSLEWVITYYNLIPWESTGISGGE